MAIAKIAARGDAAERIACADWADIERSLNERGYGVIRDAMGDPECRWLRGLYDRGESFRSRVVMARHGFGQGEYQYFTYPLPAAVADLREMLYARLAGVANNWAAGLGAQVRYPAELNAFLKECHAHGQSRPTPLMLKYGPGDYNRLHQDLYGGIQFPLQATVLLSAREEFEGGEFVLTETAARRQTRVEAVSLERGDMIVFAVNHRPVRSAKGMARVAMRHGVSIVRRGARMTLGIILHDAA